MSAVPDSPKETFPEAPDSKIRERFFGTGQQPERPNSGHKGGQKFTPTRQKNPSRSCPDDPVPAEKSTSCKLDEPVKLLMADKGALAQKPITVMTAFQMTADRYHDNDAFAVRVDGKWQKTKLRDMYRMVRTIAKGFLRLGLGRFHGVGIMGYNAPEWIISYLAAIFAGGVAVGIHYEHPAEECQRVALNVQCNIIVVNSTEDLAKVLEIRSNLPELQAIVQYGKEGFQKTHGVISWSELLEMGDRASEDRLKESILSQAPNYCCAATFTVGRTGPPKTVMLSHDNVIWTAKMFGKYQSFSSSDGVHVSYQPLSQPIGQLIDIFIPLLFATTVYFVPWKLRKHHLIDIIREVQPTFFATVPFVYERIVDHLQIAFEQSALQKAITKMAMDIGRKAYLNLKEGKPRPFGWWLANQLVFKRVRNKIGLERCIEVHSGGMFILPSTEQFFLSLNILLLDNYGSSELSGPHAISLPERHRVGSCGVEMDGCRTKFVPVEHTTYTEIRVKGRHVFMGYLNEPQMTADSFDEDGWHKTEDLGYKDDNGFLWLTGTVDGLMWLTDGRVVSVNPIELAFRDRLPFVGQCIVIGNQRPYIILLLTIDAQTDDDTGVPLDVVSKKAEFWLRKINVKISPISEMVASPPNGLFHAIQTVINQVNESVLDRSTAIRKWKLLPRDFTTPTGEFTMTHRLKRHVIHEKYSEMIDALYAEG